MAEEAGRRREGDTEVETVEGAEAMEEYINKVEDGILAEEELVETQEEDAVRHREGESKSLLLGACLRFSRVRRRWLNSLISG